MVKSIKNTLKQASPVVQKFHLKYCNFKNGLENLPLQSWYFTVVFWETQLQKISVKVKLTQTFPQYIPWQAQNILHNILCWSLYTTKTIIPLRSRNPLYIFHPFLIKSPLFFEIFQTPLSSKVSCNPQSPNQIFLTALSYFHST